ncbi:hypothetical protein GQ600_9258 [Phytophthora cactorum]|nr:hypothetical protein GQ600_9258 [Phytophthora cactorum]
MMEAWIPGEAAAELWKEKLRRAFGVTGYDFGSRYEVTEPADPSRIPLPKTPTNPKSNAAKMCSLRLVNVLHSKTTVDTRRVSMRCEGHRSKVTDDSSGSDGDYKNFTGDGGAVLLAKRGEKEHVYDYLKRHNGYARNAGIKFEGSGRKDCDYVKPFLETCGDRGLEKQLCHIRVIDIHELEEIIMAILKIEERTTTREPTQLNSRSREHSRRREERRHEDSCDGYERRE